MNLNIVRLAGTFLTLGSSVSATGTGTGARDLARAFCIGTQVWAFVPDGMPFMLFSVMRRFYISAAEKKIAAASDKMGGRAPFFEPVPRIGAVG